MAESTKVRLVRCPKCENLLPELADYSVYQCGGCGAVLRAKIENREDGKITTAVEKLDEESKVVETAKQQHSVENEAVEMSDASDTEVKPNGCSMPNGEMKSEKNNVGVDDSRDDRSKASSGKWVVENGLDGCSDGDNLDDSAGRENHSLNSHITHATSVSRSGRMSDQQHAEMGNMEEFLKTMRNKGEGARFSSSKLTYPDEGPSNYNLDSSYGYRGSLGNNDDRDGSYRVQYLENDRMELLKKLDELKEQLNRSCGINEKPNGKIPFRGRMDPPDCYGSDSWYPSCSSTFTRVSTQLPTPDKQAAGPQHFNHQPEPFPHTHMHEMGMRNLYPSTYESNHMPRYENHLRPQMLRKTSHQLPSRFQEVPPQYFSGHYVDTAPDPYLMDGAFHQPSCPCFHCEKLYGVPSAVPRAACSNGPVIYHHDNPKPFNPLLPNSRLSVPPPSNFHSAQSHARWPSDLKSELDGYIRSRPRRVFLASGRRCRPIAGGAPLLTCLNCYEVLQLPRKLMLMAKDQQKMQCGACSAVINLSVINGKLVLSMNSEPVPILKEVVDGSNKMMREHMAYSLGRMDHTNANFSSDDYDNSGYDFQTVDSDPITSRCEDLNLMRPQEMHNFHSSSHCTSEDDNSPDTLSAQVEVIESVQQPTKESLSPPPPGSPLQQLFDYSNNHLVNRFGKGNCSSRSEQEKVVSNKTATRQNSMKETSLATEMEVPFHEYCNTRVSQDSGDASREDEPLKINKGGEKSIVNIIKRSFKDLSRANHSDDRVRSNVSVNGHLIPARQVKKAEKLAGPVHPGEYWYDFRAGFWGVMGGPCRGIIPPFIEEFNYTMPENCAGGTTGVYVNGRELHQKDLDLLASRGLLTDRDRSYIVEISGRVLDEDTGEELDSLGKLAPTVERMKRGFGMKVPKAAS